MDSSSNGSHMTQLESHVHSVTRVQWDVVRVQQACLSCTKRSVLDLEAALRADTLYSGHALAISGYLSLSAVSYISFKATSIPVYLDGQDTAAVFVWTYCFLLALPMSHEVIVNLSSYVGPSHSHTYTLMPCNTLLA